MEKNIFHRINGLLDKYLTITELLFLVIITLFLLLDTYMDLPLMSSSFYALVVLSIFYYLKSIGDYTQGFDGRKFIMKIPYLGLSFICLGIAFEVRGVTSMSYLLLVGLPFTLLGTILYFTTKQEYSSQIKYRFLLFTIFGAALGLYFFEVV